jgi:hypothetical protein
MTAVFEATGKFPEPGTPPSQESKALRTKFALQSDNLTMQKYNTGLPGHKLKGVPDLDKQFPEAQLPNYRGGSAFVTN